MKVVVLWNEQEGLVCVNEDRHEVLEKKESLSGVNIMTTVDLPVPFREIDELQEVVLSTPSGLSVVTHMGDIRRKMGNTYMD